MPVSQKVLGSRLRKAREACQLTQGDVGDRLGVSRSTVAQVELGNRPVRSGELQNLANVYGCRPEFFLERESEEEAWEPILRGAPAVASSPRTLEALRSNVLLTRTLAKVEATLGITASSGPTVSYTKGIPASTWEALEHGTSAAQEERRRLNLGEAPVRNVAERLGVLGMRTTKLPFQPDVSCVFLNDSQGGILLAVNGRSPHSLRRFAYAHAYAHVLFDQNRPAWVCQAENRSSLIEARANSFASAFLMPDQEVRAFLTRLGKRQSNRGSADIFDVFADRLSPARSEGAMQVRQRGLAWSSRIMTAEVAQLAAHFGVSRFCVLHRLRNLRFLTQAEFGRHTEAEEAGIGETVEELLELRPPKGDVEQDGFRRRLLVLALEARRQGLISMSELQEITGQLDMARETFGRLKEALDAAGDNRG